MRSDYDILILGGGLVGSSLACALDGHGLRIALVEAALPAAPAPGFDERKLALALASINALVALAVFDDASAVSPIQRIHASRSGDFGVVRLDASDYGREFFGGVISARELGVMLEKRVCALASLDLMRPAQVTAITSDGDCMQLQLQVGDQQRAVTCRLLVAADGTHSFARRAMGIETDEHDYAQSLVVCSVSTNVRAGAIAYERFSDQGPVALLPMHGEYGAICGVSADAVESVMALDDAGFARYFQDRFGWRAGRVERVGRRSAHPLRRVVARQLIAGRMVLVGNAAQTIHPIGAQGFNLGLRDALSLAALITGGADGDRNAAAGDPGDAGLLARYVSVRQEDRERTLAFSDGLARLTTNPSFPMHFARSLGLLALGHVPGLSSPLVAGAMGFRGDVPRLARSRE